MFFGVLFVFADFFDCFYMIFIFCFVLYLFHMVCFEVRDDLTDKTELIQSALLPPETCFSGADKWGAPPLTPTALFHSLSRYGYISGTYRVLKQKDSHHIKRKFELESPSGNRESKEEIF